MTIYKLIATKLKSEMDLQPGDHVKITHKVPSFHLGWKAHWVEEMDKYVGKILEVSSITTSNNSVFVLTNNQEHGWNFPYHALELVSRKQLEPVELTIDDIAVKFGIKPEQVKIKK